MDSYFGLRGIEARDGKLYLNGKPLFQRLVLDQGFYPDGIYTAPSDEAIRADIELAQSLGFNGARLHRKVFEEQYLYWADRLGFLTGGEYADWGFDLTADAALSYYQPEWIEAIPRDYNHLSSCR